MSCLCSWRCWSIPWRNKIKCKSRNVVGYLNSCLPLYWNRSLPANCSPLSTAGSKGVIHWRHYGLASQSMKFLHWPALPTEVCWLALSRWVRLDGCTLANFLTQISLYLPYVSMSLSLFWKYSEMDTHNTFFMNSTLNRVLTSHCYWRLCWFPCYCWLSCSWWRPRRCWFPCYCWRPCWYWFPSCSYRPCCC